MADISKIKTPDGTTYDVKDTVARNITCSLTMSGNVITLTLSSGGTSSVTLPIYDGSIR